ncbi:hypothetical protein [Streptomyces sp. NPDC057253]|uniref:hypothetical protein n=1 Tax=Streptomyces sp. NPDC057253 TaxID=3346069 RepID=UPI00363160D7
MKPRVGQTLASTVDETAVIVVRAPDREVKITCGGAEMSDAREKPARSGVPDPGQTDGTLLGKRYADDELGIELLCTKPGQGTLAVDGSPLAVKAAKALPASD